MYLVSETHQTKIIDLVEVISEGLNCFYVIRPPCLGNTALVQGPQRPQVGADRQRTGRHGTQHLLQPLQSAVSHQDVEVDAGEVPAVQVPARGDAVLHEEVSHDITKLVVECTEDIIHWAWKNIYKKQIWHYSILILPKNYKRGKFPLSLMNPSLTELYVVERIGREDEEDVHVVVT